MCAIDTFETYRPLLIATARRMLGSAAEAEDVVQEAYIRFHMAACQEIRSPRAFLRTIVTRLCLDTLGSARVTREQSLGGLLTEPALAEELPLETAVQHESISRAVSILLERLSPEERAVFVLHAVFEYPHPEIAALLGLSLANSRQLFHRAQRHLSAEQARFAPAPEAHHRLVTRFLAAAQHGDLSGLAALLAGEMTEHQRSAPAGERQQRYAA